MRVWIHYDPANPELQVYRNDPPTNFGRRQHDIGPLEIDDELIMRYEATQDAWRSVRSEMLLAVQAEGPGTASVEEQARSGRATF